MTYFKRTQAKYVKKQYKITNWSEYDKAIETRGSVTLWISDEAIAGWTARRSGEPGGQRKYSSIAIETSLAVRLVYHLPWRQTRGFLRSMAEGLELDSHPVPSLQITKKLP